jgi:hypothetical protein
MTPARGLDALVAVLNRSAGPRSILVSGNSDRYRDKPPRRGAFGASHAIVGLTYNASLSLQPPVAKVS